MATPQYFYDTCDIAGDPSPPQKWKPFPAEETAMDNPNGCFDCNICLENAQDPIVTLCGHLFCWPCIYKWLHFQSTSVDTEQKQQQCPVCKADISHTTLVPLYGRGPSESKASNQDIIIPQRPPAYGLNALKSHDHLIRQIRQSPNRNQDQLYYPQYSGDFPAMASITSTPRGTTTMSLVHPMVGMLGEMVNGRAFGNSELNFYSGYQNMGSISPRLRRLEMKATMSLNRISIFLFCFVVLCFLLF